MNVKKAALAPPNITAEAPVKLVPVIVTLVPPPGTPVPGDTAVTVGTDAGATKVNRLVPVPVPFAVVTATLTAPAACAVVVAVIEVALTNVTAVGALPPIKTEVAPVKLVPVMVTAVPPAMGPLAGEIPVTVGG